MKIYICKVSTKNKLDALLPLLPEHRVRAYKKCKNFADQRRSLAASLMLYKAMDDYNIPKDIEVSFNEWGKLMFPEEEMFYVNLSHSGDYAVCAVDSQEIGVDLEVVRACSDGVLRKIRNEFDAEEIDKILAMKDDNEKNHAFTRFWTKKESQVKLSGKGIADMMDADFLRTHQIYTKTLRIYGECYLSISSYGKIPKGEIAVEVV